MGHVFYEPELLKEEGPIVLLKINQGLSTREAFCMCVAFYLVFRKEGKRINAENRVRHAEKKPCWPPCFPGPMPMPP